MTYIMTILSLLKRLRYQTICYQPTAKKIAEKYNISIGLVSKLIPTLRDKKEYVLHYCNLQLYLDLGLKIKEVHRVLRFDQSPWLKQYIDFNTEK